MGDRTQRLKGKANNGAAQTLEGKTQQTVGKARSAATKATR